MGLKQSCHHCCKVTECTVTKIMTICSECDTYWWTMDGQMNAALDWLRLGQAFGVPEDRLLLPFGKT